MHKNELIDVPSSTLLRVGEALNAARDALLWWENQHGCCEGATDDAFDAIESALEELSGYTNE